MQRILICTNWGMGISGLADYLADVYKQDRDIIQDKIWTDEKFRCDEKLLNLMENNNFELPDGYYISEYNHIKVNFKIIEVPDDVEWHIEDKQCDCGEVVVENYRTWR